MARHVKPGGLRAQMEQYLGIVVSRGLGMGLETLDSKLEDAGREPSEAGMEMCTGAATRPAPGGTWEDQEREPLRDTLVHGQ